MKYRYLTFDCYGTLIDWRAGIEASLLAAVGDFGIRGQALLDAYVMAEKQQESSYKKYREVLRRTVLSMSGQLGVEVTEEAARKFAGSVPTWPAYADSAKFLKQMGTKGYERYILSNVDTDLLSDTISNHGLEVDGFVTAEDVGSYKPNPGHWLRFMKNTGARKEEVLHVAQSIYHDIVPTNEMGIASAWVNRYDEPMPQGPHPLFVSDSLAHLAESLDQDLP
ncbi:MAG TPA: haloacid dehalogenase type II [Nitrososphaerales archaeon]|nr:haloacid dehalogenase type II [Nitrososphaerales archaeon]